MSEYGLQYVKAIYDHYNEKEKKSKSLAERLTPYQTLDDIDLYRRMINPGNHKNIAYPVFQKRIPRKLKKKLKKRFQFNYTPYLKAILNKNSINN